MTENFSPPNDDCGRSVMTGAGKHIVDGVWRWLFAVLCAAILALPPAPAAAQALPDTLKGHGGPIKAITIAPDGKHALTASFDYSIIHWELSGDEGRILHRMTGHDGPVNDVAFLPGNTRAVSVSDDGSLALWDLEQGVLITRIESEPVKVLDVAVSADGAKAAAARWDHTAKIYDLEKQSEIATLEGHKGNVNAVAFSADGKRLYTAAYDGEIIEWDVAAAELERPVYRHGWGVNSIALIDDGRLLFGALNGTVGVLDLTADGAVETLASKSNPVQNVELSDDGTLLAYADTEGEIEVFDAATAAKIAGGPVAYGPVWDFDFMPDGKQIYLVGLDDFAIRWQVTPREIARIQSEIPRRFQLTESDDPGELEFQRKCSVCHTLTPDDENRAGPTLYGVFGRKAGAVPDYDYSKALRESGIVWNEETIGRLFDHGPDVVVPGTKMPIQRLKSVERRDALIRFLKAATSSLE